MRIRDGKIQIRDPGSWMEKSRIRDKHPGSATLYLSMLYLVFAQGLPRNYLQHMGLVHSERDEDGKESPERTNFLSKVPITKIYYRCALDYRYLLCLFYVSKFSYPGFFSSIAGGVLVVFPVLSGFELLDPMSTVPYCTYV
jgi:hypothetical protein